MLACDANADVFPGRRFFRRPEIPVHLCAQAKLYVRQLFSFVRGTYGINMSFLKQKQLFVGLESWFSFSAWLCFENIKVTVRVFVIILSLRARSPFGGILRSQARAACERRRESERLCHPLARSREACLTY